MPVMFEIIFVSVLFGLLKQAEYEVWRETHCRNVTATASSVMKLFYDSATAQLAYHSSRQEIFIPRYQASVEEIRERIRQLESLGAGRPDELARIAPIREAALEMVRILDKSADVIMLDPDHQTDKQYRIMRREFQGSVPTLLRKVSDLMEYEAGLGAGSPEAQEAARARVLVFLVAGIAGSSLLAFALAMYFNKSTVARLRIVMDNTSRMVRHEPLLPPVAGSDEISKLDSVFHDMATALDDAARRKQELISMVSHDLRTPLMSVQAAVTLVNSGAMGKMPVPVETVLRQAENSTGHLIRLINDLLDIEKLEAGRLPMVVHEMQTGDLMDRCFDSISSFAQQHSVDLVIQDPNLRMVADSDRLAQVLINLLSNAIKFSPPEGTVTLRVTQFDNWVEFRVIDEGRGVPAEMCSKIFERFQQVSASDGQRGKGTGLGLAICKAIVESHSGRIGVDSVEGKGSEFWFQLPMEEAPSLVLEPSV